MFARRARPQQRLTRHNLVLLLIPFVPVLVLFSGLIYLAPYGSSQQANATAAAYALIAIIVPFSINLPDFRSSVSAQIALALLLVAYYLAGFVTFKHTTTWTLLASPAVFTLVAFMLSRPLLQLFIRRLVMCIAIAAFLGMIYLADIWHLWWQPLLVSLVVCGLTLLFLRIFEIRPRHRGMMIGAVTTLATGAMVLASFALGFILAYGGPRGVGGAFIACIGAGIGSQFLTMRQRILVWCALTLLILAISALFVAGTLTSELMIAAAFLSVIGAAVASWRVQQPLPPPPPTPRRYPPQPYYLDDGWQELDPEEDHETTEEDENV